MKYTIELNLHADDESEARKIARVIIADAEVTVRAFRHEELETGLLLRPRPGDTGMQVVTL